MEAKVVKFKLLKRIIFIETGTWLMSHIRIDFGRPFDIEFFPLLLLVSWCDNVRVFHIVGVRCPHQRYLRDGKGTHCSSFTKKFFPARKHVWEICVRMFITSNKWLKVFDMSPTREDTPWPFLIINITHTQHKLLNASAWNSSAINIRHLNTEFCEYIRAYNFV